MTRRTERISSLIKKEISDLLLEQVNDPRLSGFISVTEVWTSNDLMNAKIYISTLGGEASKGEILEGFNAASGFLRRELGSRLRLRQIPHLSFHFDDSIEKGARILGLIEQVTSDDAENEGQH
ncbi:MAG: 30S ribosome-binding factor RbfA [Chloroflexi bacterium]|nr:30S ribosome-binding factor RbfA [Chloroflexota bacterium]MBM3154701.1 30S ribosome-binding factor RbfA [Chloroflexota bacterium]MBM3175200.1 30S ribosome-binding factor RbfA [Chloroflexota bacterium]MBM4449955.1 30S ribosome-binding factor RbfA [Chloroflexota bacterium]